MSYGLGHDGVLALLVAALGPSQRLALRLAVPVLDVLGALFEFGRGDGDVAGLFSFFFSSLRLRVALPWVCPGETLAVLSGVLLAIVDGPQDGPRSQDTAPAKVRAPGWGGCPVCHAIAPMLARGASRQHMRLSLVRWTIKRTRSCGVGLNRIPNYELFTAYDATDSLRHFLVRLAVC